MQVQVQVQTMTWITGTHWGKVRTSTQKSSSDFYVHSVTCMCPHSNTSHTTTTQKAKIQIHKQNKRLKNISTKVNMLLLRHSAKICLSVSTVCACICVCVYMFKCVCMYVQVCVPVCMDVSAGVYVQGCVCAYLCMCMCVYRCVCTCKPEIVFKCFSLSRSTWFFKTGSLTEPGTHHLDWLTHLGSGHLYSSVLGLQTALTWLGTQSQDLMLTH